MEHKKRAAKGLLILIFTVIFVAGAILSASASLRKLPPTTLYTLQGREESVPRSSWVILYFFPPDCWSCLTEITKLYNQIQQERELLFFPVCLDCDWRKARDLYDSFPQDIEFYLLSSLDQATLGIWDKPTVFLVSPTGRVVQRWNSDQVNIEEIKKSLGITSNQRRSIAKKPKSPCGSTLCE